MRFINIKYALVDIFYTVIHIRRKHIDSNTVYNAKQNLTTTTTTTIQ